MSLNDFNRPDEDTYTSKNNKPHKFPKYKNQATNRFKMHSPEINNHLALPKYLKYVDGNYRADFTAWTQLKNVN